MHKIEKLTSILVGLHKAQPASIAENDRNLLARADSRDLALAQSNMLAEGTDATELWRMWNRNKDILPDQVAKLRAELAPNHVVRRILAEHDMILCFIADLDDVNIEIQKLPFASSSTHEIRSLGHLAKHFMSAEQHREREEEIIFPELVRRGYANLLQTVNAQHFEISRGHRKLRDLVWQIDTMEFGAFKEQLAEIVHYLVPTMRIHVFFEDSIILPLALEVISDRHAWKRIKEICDQIGYCGYDS